MFVYGKYNNLMHFKNDKFLRRYKSVDFDLGSTGVQNILPQWVIFILSCTQF